MSEQAPEKLHITVQEMDAAIRMLARVLGDAADKLHEAFLPQKENQ